MICALVKGGRKVGVTATSHKVIAKLLSAVAEAAAETGLSIRLGHRGGANDVKGDDETVTRLDSNNVAAEQLQAGQLDVVGGTSWLWSRPELAQAADVLFVDEAGQMSLANAVAVSPAAPSLVLLGDPQQLEQPQKGTHPDGADRSALQHFLGEHRTMPPDRDMFLPVTWRLAPPVCDYTSELFYESKLRPRDDLTRQTLTDGGDLTGSGLRILTVEHDGNRNCSNEEIEAVGRLVARLTGSATPTATA
jgi:uncharacterized protein